MKPIGDARISENTDKVTSARKKTAVGALAAAFALVFTAPFFQPFIAGVGMPFAEQVPADLPAGVGTVEGLPEPDDFSKPRLLDYSTYTIRQGDTISELATDFGLAQDSILSVNGITNSRLLQIGRQLRIPNQDGIMQKIREGQTLADLAEKYEIDEQAIRVANGIMEGEPVAESLVFLPSAKLARVDLQEINGDLFIWPVRGYVSSPYGWRTSPFTGARQFHSGLDIASQNGNPVKAAMSGRVSSTGYDVNSGNYIVLSHYSGYRTFYGHLDVIRVKVGENVRTGQRIGDVGSTGLSTGSHLHFTVFKNGVTVNPINLMN